MLNSQGYKGLIWRFALAGTLNGIVGFSAIFILMALGVSPLLSNLAGYALGLSVGFKTSKSFVFRSKGKWAIEGIRFIAAFGLSYLANILILAVALDWLAFPPFLAQIAAVSTYVLVMYVLSYFFVFPNTLDAGHIKNQFRSQNMAEVRTGLRHILARPKLYDLFQTAVGANAWRKDVIEEFLRNGIPAGGLIIDIGCGTGEILSYLPDNLRYLGIDRNADYISYAKERYRHRNAEFLNRELTPDLPLQNYKADAVLAIGLIHHLDDHECITLFQAAKQTLRPGGVFLALDPVYHPAQSAAARYIISKDRGKAVRTMEQYMALYTREFSQIQCDINHAPLRIPYTGVVFRCRV